MVVRDGLQQSAPSPELIADVRRAVNLESKLWKASLFKTAAAWRKRLGCPKDTDPPVGDLS